MSEKTFTKVLIKPKYSEIISRKDVNIGTILHERIKLDLPILSANMKTITGPDMALAMIASGGAGILHRFNTIEEAVDDYFKVRSVCITNHNILAPIIVSIGVQDADKQRFEALFKAGARLFCIDVAHGHHISVKNMIKWIRNEMLKWSRESVTIIAGNIATDEAYIDLVDWGADIIKCGIGSGSACHTRKNTGIGVPQLQALESITKARTKSNLKNTIISDGGIETTGDIAKALVYADAVMLGGMLAGTTETPGKVYKNEQDQYYKFYAGSASAEIKNDNGKTVEYVEGFSKTVIFKGSVEYILREIKEGLQSSLSYVNAKTLAEFRKKAEFVEI